LVILICIFALGCAYVGFALMINSGFMFFDIDYNEVQRQTTGIKADILSSFCFIGLCVSIAMLFLSGRIARFILNRGRKQKEKILGL
jgi:hypothetical protein